MTGGILEWGKEGKPHPSPWEKIAYLRVGLRREKF